MGAGRGCCWVVIGMLLGPGAAWAEKVPQLASARYMDPLLEIPQPLMRFRDDLQPLWIAALQSDETDLKLEAAFTLAWSHRRGMAVTEAAIDALLENLADPQHSVRLAAAQALTALDARRAADALIQRLDQRDLEMAQLVEPALARWDIPAAREMWRLRVRDPADQPPWRLLAIRGLGQVRDARASADLGALAAATAERADLRLAAAAAVGQIAEEGAEHTARSLIERAGPDGSMERLIAAHLLRNHSSPAARDLLVRLVQDEDSSIAVVALERMVEIAPDSILPLAESSLSRGDANVRRLVATALIARPSLEGLSLLANLLSDPHPDLRAFVADGLCDLASSAAWRAAVLAEGEQALDSADWRAQEQALRMVTRLDQKQHAERCMTLLAHPRPEVYVTAAWALRSLAVSSTLGPALTFATQLDQRRLDGTLVSVNAQGFEQQLTQLMEFFGQQRYAPATPFLLTFVPKTLVLPEARGAAIWALGYVHETESNADLVRLLEARLRDTIGLEPECMPVRYFAAIALGRMRATDALPSLRIYAREGTSAPIGYACAWSVQQVTGEPYEKPITPIRYYSAFFLEPLPEP